MVKPLKDNWQQFRDIRISEFGVVDVDLAIAFVVTIMAYIWPGGVWINHYKNPMHSEMI
ncbi:hypothetical protein [Okeania sp. SIO1I7]|uniref:hypothetical protein n=1 Tax=Okeania sp. SIO1I7 TaxID=2607772 RepID=UPI0013FB0F39|nr:hypothetical protein [Okeania sp. SIO1I7]NET26214.1 hypothetical protein [Okeania sp. SIO1I7]